MKKITLYKFIVCMSLLAMLPCISVADDTSRVQELIALKQSKMETLKKCKGTTKNLKIAGLSTLGITTVGVGVNIAEAVILDKKKKELADEQAKSKEAGFKYNCEQLELAEYDKETKTCTLKRETGTLNDKDKEFIGDITCDEDDDTKTCTKDEFKIVVKNIQQKQEENVEKNEINEETERIENKDKFARTHIKDFNSQSKCLVMYKSSGKKINIPVEDDINNCKNIEPGKWYAQIDGKTYNGITKCSITDGKHATIGNPSDISGKYCWCKTSDNWVRYALSKKVNQDNAACNVVCSVGCIQSLILERDFRSNLDKPNVHVEEKKDITAEIYEVAGYTCKKRINGTFKSLDTKECKNIKPGTWWLLTDNNEKQEGSAVCSTTLGQYAKSGKPVINSKGKYCWCKASKSSSYVYYGELPACFELCAQYCTNEVMKKTDFWKSLNK